MVVAAAAARGMPGGRPALVTAASIVRVHAGRLHLGSWGAGHGPRMAHAGGLMVCATPQRDKLTLATIFL